MTSPRVRELLDGARAQTGLDDFGADTFREGLEVLVDSLEREARLNETGERMAFGRLGLLLANRLRIEDWYERHPEIDEQEVPEPIFVLGLPRTGTTALSHLLSQDPDTRSLRTWESSQPVPPPEKATEHSDPRIAATRAGMDAAEKAFPGMRAMHDATPTGPTECQDLLGMDFRAYHFAGQYRVPRYAQWVLECDMEPAYRQHRRTLKLLQWHCPPDRWHLKTPVHMLSLGALTKVYPDARFAMTHRDPAKVLPSVCSLISFLYAMTSDEVDREEVGREESAVWAEALRRAIAFRDATGGERFADLTFRELNEEPVAAVERVYRRLGVPMTDAARARMQAWVRDNPRGKHGEHRYRLEDFGLERSAIRDRYAFYVDRFAVPAEGA